MPTFVVYLAVLAALFAAVFITKRRFGMLGLALATGYVISQSLSHYEAIIVRYTGGSMFIAPAILSIIVILLPAIAMLFHGSKYKTLPTTIIGGLLFAVLGFVFLIDPISRIVVFQGLGVELFARIVESSNFIIIVGLAVAVIDTVLFRSHHHSVKDKKH